MKQTKRTKLLFIAPDYYGFDNVVQSGFEKHSDYEVIRIVSNEPFRYSSLKQRVINFFSKTFFNKNLKHFYSIKQTISVINNYPEYEVLIVNRPDMLPEEVIKVATSKSKHSIVLFWDSFDKLKGQKEMIPFFDTCFSFDANDCINYNLKKNTNFYFVTESIDNPENDVFFIGTFDNRFKNLQKIINTINKKGLKGRAKLYSPDEKIVKENTNESITFLEKIIPFKDSYVYNQQTKIILDLRHKNQTGLSFRPFEALGMRKKLITDNSQIINYDFYNPNNIFIIKDYSSDIPDWFFTTPYKDIDDDIYRKYNLENWIKNILKK